ncbi:MAG TPA: twin-arginine translocase subunit TatC [Candidatus Aminicenantes bacterium]|nr:twin-arginine translocase subunit TatC [Candidatus Aminicenantes bacterium]HRY64277.1 twin-arginine translocase subunit TatC [Candidatus Aminicenantes bacterium]HRZ71190.1 twin-arginine translocase subunit TatC [Candidatus Aminicenantes bacterium]
MRLGKAKKSPDEMTFLEHLEDLRKRLFYSALVLIGGFFPCWAFRETFFDILARPVMKYFPPGTKFSYLTLTAPFMMYLKISFLASLFISAPFIFLQIWYFVAPGLYQKEKKYVVPFVLMTTFFFALGVAFGYFVVYPFACRFFISIGKDFQAVLTPDQYLGFSVKVLLGIALVFELPTLIFFLAKMGLVTARWMIRNFKYAVLAVFIIAAVITPTPDPVTQSIVAIPMLVLYGLGIVIALVVGRGKEKARRAETERAG